MIRCVPVSYTHLMKRETRSAFENQDPDQPDSAGSPPEKCADMVCGEGGGVFVDDDSHELDDADIADVESPPMVELLDQPDEGLDGETDDGEDARDEESGADGGDNAGQRRNARKKNKRKKKAGKKR